MYSEKKKLSKKELMIVEAYKNFFPNLEKACVMAKVGISEVLRMMEDNYKFKTEMEAVKVGAYSIAETVLIDLLENDKTATTHKIAISKVILQYKRELCKF